MKTLRDVLFGLLLEPLVSSGRIGRLTYLQLVLWAHWPLFVPLLLADLAKPVWAQYVLSAFVVAGFCYWFVALLATAVRRLHDIGRSGYWVLLINLIWPLLLIWPGQRQSNRYGAPASKLRTSSPLLGDA
ncbi:MAG: DUF805 domain-containing protein [Gammaproteobacteria bacterium]|nr:DUF805 domain-containing protein [Gammaproteobacteria bacterium]MBU1489645.1 DUF805 domain-containing protein [Gammaproteobacteria bacterium]MBU2064907.1 DUF805 domain-containing protein [Gammaproteobacteria bacterium]MBU2139253.1 DUF805 domain-containing protein [Gammaproteobacteria bacterium]MBU2215191.1 DUF805 domain-containing protein [Gammaproteobacteria bacterium]